MTEVDLPLWAEAIVAALVLAGAAVALLGSSGLLRLPTFFERVHVPAIIATLGCWCVTLGTAIFFSVQRGDHGVYRHHRSHFDHFPDARRPVPGAADGQGRAAQRQPQCAARR